MDNSRQNATGMHESKTTTIESRPNTSQAPPSVKFNPPMYLQRRAAVHEIVRDLSLKRGPFTSLLDVGCGSEVLFVSSVLPCEDTLPLRVLTGLDIDDKLKKEGRDRLLGEYETDQNNAGDRWMDLDVSLICGGFSTISKEYLGCYDVIISSEVIEHLDPELVEQFSKVLLGRMQPKVLVVSTPNRDFNRLFEMPFISETSCDEKGRPILYDPMKDPTIAHRRYYRQPHTYAMRHDDHRFEWTRQEFQSWASKAAETFGYIVDFTGCGVYGQTVELKGSGWNIQGTLHREMERKTGRKCYINTEMELNRAARTAFGDCTQIAVFVRQDVMEHQICAPFHYYPCSWQPQLPKSPQTFLTEEGDGNLTLAFHKTWEASNTDHYPPSFEQIIEALKPVCTSFVPPNIIGTWIPSPADQKSTGSDEHMSEDEQIHCDVLFVKTDLFSIWNRATVIRQLCHNHFYEFANILSAENTFKQLPRIEVRDIKKPFDLRIVEHNVIKAEKFNNKIAQHTDPFLEHLSRLESHILFSLNNQKDLEDAVSALDIISTNSTAIFKDPNRPAPISKSIIFETPMDTAPQYKTVADFNPQLVFDMTERNKSVYMVFFAPAPGSQDTVLCTNLQETEEDRKFFKNVYKTRGMRSPPSSASSSNYSLDDWSSTMAESHSDTGWSFDGNAEDWFDQLLPS